MEKLPVIFRAEKSGDFKGEVTAVFPTLPSDYAGRQMTCYAHIGQHSGCDFAWYHGTRAAKPYEYADLLAELRSIYEAGEDAVELVVCQRMTQRHRDAFNAEAQRYRDAVAGESPWVQGRIGESV